MARGSGIVRVGLRVAGRGRERRGARGGRGFRRRRRGPAYDRERVRRAGRRALSRLREVRAIQRARRVYWRGRVPGARPRALRRERAATRHQGPDRADRSLHREAPVRRVWIARARGCVRRALARHDRLARRGQHVSASCAVRDRLLRRGERSLRCDVRHLPAPSARRRRVRHAWRVRLRGRGSAASLVHRRSVQEPDRVRMLGRQAMPRLSRMLQRCVRLGRLPGGQRLRARYRWLCGRSLLQRGDVSPADARRRRREVLGARPRHGRRLDDVSRRDPLLRAATLAIVIALVRELVLRHWDPEGEGSAGSASRRSGVVQQSSYPLDQESRRVRLFDEIYVQCDNAQVLELCCRVSGGADHGEISAPAAEALDKLDA